MNKNVKKVSKKNHEETIEIIDIFDEIPKTKQIVKKKLKKGLVIQASFWFISLAFIIGCFIFYGIRFVKYYKLFNPKDENGKAVQLIGNHITSGATFVYEGEGLYLMNGNYIYKGKEVNNYVKYSNFIWRILKINEDKSIDIILDDSINNLKWNNKISSYSDSDINTYLNDYFLNMLNKDLLTNTTVCDDIINTTNEIKCSKPDTKNMVRLLNVDEFLNSKADDKTFITNGNSIWLSSRGDTKAWTINEESISYADVTNTYEVKPVVRLKSTNQVYSGKGTKDSPYVIEKETKEVKIGSHVKLGDDIWTVYDIKDKNLMLSLTTLYKNGTKTYRFDTKTNTYNPANDSSLAKYLNGEYYESLSYKEKLIDTTWYTGEYKDSYKDIMEKTVNAKVGLTSIIDLKLDDATSYYLLNGLDNNKIYLYDNELIESKPTLSRGMKPSICIKNTKIISGDGTIDSPYVLED